MTASSRREFLGLVGTATIASPGLSRPTNAQETRVVEMGNDYFDPIGLHVEPGTTVRFDLAVGSHSATAYPDRIPTEATAFDSDIISDGSFAHTFEAPGTYDYYCIPHRSIGMVGRIVVGEPGGPAEDEQIPDGEVPASETIVQEGEIAYGSDVDGSGDTDDDAGMMGGNGPGMMNGRNSGWIGALTFVGGTLGIFGVLGGALYWLTARGDASANGSDSAVQTLQTRYASGEIDEETYRRRMDRLTEGDIDGPE